MGASRSGMIATPVEMTGTPEAQPLAAALERLRLEGSIFIRAEYTEGWGYHSFDGPTNAGVLHPGAQQVLMFHLIADGRCWIALDDDGVKHWAERGDVVVIPFGDRHTMGGADDAELVPLEQLITPPPWDSLPVIRHGAGGPQTDVVCGYLHCDDPLFDPALRGLPGLFVVRPPEGPLARWVQASIDFAVEASNPTGRTPDTISARLPELLLVEVLRLHLADTPAVDRGWMGALHDPVLAPAMALLHNEPERKWTVAELAGEVAVSRSVLDARFREVLGRSPIRYLTDWRMHLAEDLLASSDATVAEVSRRVGYESEEAFSRAFKRAHGVAPSAWRADR
jgi:AraC-like DNA-binding protein